MKQIQFKDLMDDDKMLGGILLDDGSIICGCCGSLIEKDNPDFEIVEEFKTWADISEAIMGIVY